MALHLRKIQCYPSQNLDFPRSLFLKRPFTVEDGLKRGFNLLYQSRESALGRYSLPQMLTKVGVPLPTHIWVDEKHTQCLDQKGYIPIVSSGHAIWHIDYIEDTEQTTLEASYQTFQIESNQIDTDYAPQTITHDGYRPLSALRIKPLSNALNSKRSERILQIQAETPKHSIPPVQSQATLNEETQRFPVSPWI